MALKSTVEHMKKLIHEIAHDLEKSIKGNKAAAQRARTKTIKFAKVAKEFRKESIAEFRKVVKKKAAGAKKAKAAPKKKAAKKAKRK